MISTYAAGTVTGTVNSEIFLSSPNIQGQFRLYVDLSNMASGDFLEIRRYKAVIEGGTARVLDITDYQGAQPTDYQVIESEEVWNGLTGTANPVRFSLKQTLGTARQYDWAVYQQENLAPTVVGRTLDVSALGGAGLDWANVENQSTVVNLINTTVNAAVTGTVDADVVQWKGSTPNDLITGTVDAFSHYSNPVQANVSITGTIDANVVTWRGNQPNDLITGTIDAFTHYTNYPSSAITGSVDANVIMWRGEQPNVLISGTVDAYTHYISANAVTSIWSNATRTLTGFGTLVADIWAAVVDSSGVTTLLSRLTAGRAVNLDNLDDAISNVPTANENADALLKRDWNSVTGEASRSVLNALRFMRNKFSTTAHVNKVTIYKEDDTTEAYQKDVTTDATADPIVEG